MTAFLLSVREAWSRIESMVAFLLFVGVSGAEHFFSVSSLFTLLFIVFSNVPGSVPDREHDHLLLFFSVGETWPRIENTVAFLLSVSVSGAEHFFLFFLFYLPCLCFFFSFF